MDFYKRALNEMATLIAPVVRSDVEAKVIEWYRSMPAQGVSGEDASTSWEELGALLSADHPIREIRLGELRQKVRSALTSLDYPKGLALWIAHGSALSFLDVNEAAEYDGIANDIDGLDEVVDHVCRRLASSAIHDWETRVPSLSEDEDRDYLQSLIDGTVNMIDPAIFGRIEPMFAKYELDAAMMDMLTRAANAYGDAVQEAARDVLAEIDGRAPSGDAPEDEADSPSSDPLGGIVILSVHDKDGNRRPDLEDDVSRVMPRLNRH